MIIVAKPGLAFLQKPVVLERVAWTPRCRVVGTDTLIMPEVHVLFECSQRPDEPHSRSSRCGLYSVFDPVEIPVHYPG